MQLQQRRPRRQLAVAPLDAVALHLLALALERLVAHHVLHRLAQLDELRRARLCRQLRRELPRRLELVLEAGAQVRLERVLGDRGSRRRRRRAGGARAGEEHEEERDTHFF